jgi:hypothetical protein
LREESKARRFQQGKVSMGVQDAQRSGKLVFDIEHLSVSYDKQPLDSRLLWWCYVVIVLVWSVIMVSAKLP